MIIKILRIETNELVNAFIRTGKAEEMPSIHNNWRFNFDKHVKRKGANAFVLAKLDAPEIIEGCLIFEMKEEQVPYLSFVEVAPHNKGKKKIYDFVAGCLIAYACKLSFIHGKEHHNGWLTFEVREPNEKDQKKLMALYCKAYGAVVFDDKMLIEPEKGKLLIEKYLKR